MFGKIAKMNTIFVILSSVFVALLCSSISNAQSENEMIQAYFDNLKERKYNPRIAPKGYGGNDIEGTPVRVYSTIYLIDIHKIDDFNMDFRASFYFRQSWNDSRLAYPDMDISSIVLDDTKYIWTPDLYFVQEKEGINHKIITPNVFLRILPEGEVLFSVRLSVTFSCGMDFRKFPHDSQECRFQVGSYGKTMNQLLLYWDPTKTKPVEKTEKINVLNFELESIGWGSKVEHFSFGKFKNLEVILFFNRKIGFYITRLYIPFIILVILSWLSFWIKPKLAVLRVPLLLVIMYIMLNIGSNISSFIPPASYTKASDVWIAVCESLVFAAFLEFIFVSIISRSEKKIEKMRSTDSEAPMISISDVKEKSSSSENISLSIKVVANRLSNNRKISQQIDMVSRILFPLLFVIFNIIYWIIY